MDDAQHIHEIPFRFSNADLTDPEEPSSTKSTTYERAYGLSVYLDLATIDMDTFSTVLDRLLATREIDYPNPAKICVTVACYNTRALLAMDVQVLVDSEVAKFVLDVMRPLLVGTGSKAQLQVSVYASHDIRKVVEISAIERRMTSHHVKHPRAAASIRAIMEKNRAKTYKKGVIKYTTFSDDRQNTLNILY